MADRRRKPTADATGSAPAAPLDLLKPSADYEAMRPYWSRVRDIQDGVEALRKSKITYLPQFPNESDDNWHYRNDNSKFTDIFSDVVETLAAKPFTKEVGLVGAGAKTFEGLAEDVDRAGNHQHIFAQELFLSGIANAVDWILVDHTKVREGASMAEEAAVGARPFWVRIDARDMLEVRSAFLAGSEQFVYARIDESYTEVVNGDTVTIPCVRILIRDPLVDPATLQTVGYAPARYEIWEAEAPKGKSQVWSRKEFGPITIGVIALVPFFTGRRKLGSWYVTQPMKRVADLQLKHYQQETNLESAKELTAFPMFKGDGVNPELGADGKAKRLALGPCAVLYAPMDAAGQHGQWGILEISATSLKFLSEEIDKTERQMRELGRQPLTGGSAGLTVIAAAMASQKSSSAMQAWTFRLKDVLERAWTYTAMWLRSDASAEVFVNTDFAIEVGQEKDPEILLASFKERLLSGETVRAEYKRRNILAPEFDEDEEAKRILDEGLSNADAEERGTSPGAKTRTTAQQ